MMTATKCPNQEQLRAFGLGQLAGDESDDLIAHVGSCETCQSELETVDNAEDSLIVSLRTSGELDQFQSESDCQLATAKALGALAHVGDANGSLDSMTELPDKIGEYNIVRPLGRGGMGNVYLAKHTKLGREVALKVLAHHRLGDKRVRDRFEVEMQAVGRLSHPNIVTAHDAREISGTAVLITEFIDGFDLGQLVKRIGPLSIADACEIVRQVAVALQYTSDQGFVHRDVKPSNIMLNRSDQIKLLDLGLARIQFGDDDRPDMTGTGQAMGTADYIAPEQVADSRSVDVRADIYSLGCTLFKLLTGRAPFEDEEHSTAFAKMTAHISTPAPSLRERLPSASPKLVRLVDSMLAKDASRRPQTPIEIANQLAAFSSGNELSQLVQTAEQTKPREAESKPFASTRASAEPQPFLRRKVPMSLLIATGLASVLFGFALGLIVKITYPDGTTVTHKVPKGGKIEIGPDESESNAFRDPTGAATPDGAQAVAAQEETDPILTRVTIPVEFADGSPAIGAEVTMRMNGNDDRPLEVTCKADATGIAFNRKLPYGLYHLHIRLPNSGDSSWSVDVYDVSLEFGGSYQRKFIAPRTGEKATVAFELALAPETLEGLCFGAYSGGNYIDGIVWSPEPRKQDDRLRNFPMLGRGVVDTALGLRVRLTREVEQPDGEILEWQWHRQKDYFGDDLLLTDDSIVVQAAEFYREGDGYNVTRDLRKDDYFTNVKEEHGVQYLAFSGNHRSTTPLEFPSGKLRCDVRAIYGSATEDVISALGMKPKAGREVWLNASISPESAWVPLAFDLTDLTRGDSEKDPNALAFKTLSLKFGSTYTILLNSPDVPFERQQLIE